MIQAITKCKEGSLQAANPLHNVESELPKSGLKRLVWLLGTHQTSQSENSLGTECMVLLNWVFTKCKTGCRGIWEQGQMYMGFQGLSGRAQSTVQRKWKVIMGFGGLYRKDSVTHDLGCRTQDRTMQDIGNRMTGNNRSIWSPQPDGP